MRRQRPALARHRAGARLLVVLFYAATIVRLGGNVLNRPMLRDRAQHGDRSSTGSEQNAAMARSHRAIAVVVHRRGRWSWAGSSYAAVPLYRCSAR